MLFTQIGQHRRRRAFGIDLGGHFLHPLLIAMQVCVSDLQQAFQRDIKHLVVLQLFDEIFGPQAKIALRGRQEIVAKKFLILSQCFHNTVVAGFEVGQQFGIFYRIKCFRNVVPEELDGVGQLL